MRLFRKIILFTIIAGIQFNFGSAQAIAEPPSCKQKFLNSIKEFLVGEDNSKSTYAFSPEELVEASSFIDKPSEIQLSGFNEKMVRFQKLAIKRYEKGLDMQAINAFGKLDNFRMVDGNFIAEVRIVKQGDRLLVEVPYVTAKSAGSLGNVSRGLDVGLARFFATMTKGIEYRLFLNEGIKVVEIAPSKVVNKKLKIMLSEFGFTMTSELRDWGDASSIRTGMGPAAEFKLELTPNTRSH